MAFLESLNPSEPVRVMVERVVVVKGHFNDQTEHGRVKALLCLFETWKGEVYIVKAQRVLAFLARPYAKTGEVVHAASRRFSSGGFQSTARNRTPSPIPKLTFGHAAFFPPPVRLTLLVTVVLVRWLLRHWTRIWSVFR